MPEYSIQNKYTLVCYPDIIFYYSVGLTTIFTHYLATFPDMIAFIIFTKIK